MKNYQFRVNFRAKLYKRQHLLCDFSHRYILLTYVNLWILAVRRDAVCVVEKRKCLCQLDEVSFDCLVVPHAVVLLR